MIAYDQAVARLLALGGPLAVEAVPVARAHGRAPAGDIAAQLTQPPFAPSAMDGFAIRAADAPGPWRIIGEIAAGALPGFALGPNEAARILTGAALPEGADAVLIQEDAIRDGDRLALAAGAGCPPAGANVRPAGGDFRAGDIVAAAGVPLSAAALCLLAAAGHGEVGVHRRPLVALLATGDELVPPGTAPGPGQIVESNRAALGALVADIADVLDLGIAADRMEALAAALARARAADVLVTIGGASVGDRDLVRPALQAAGGEIDFWKVAIRPGKPMLAGRMGGTLVLGLPGNPASAYVTAQLFLLPLLRHLAGWRAPMPRVVEARLEAPLPANGNRRDHLRGRLGRDGPVLTVRAAARQDSSLMSVLAAADTLIIREIGAGAAAAGEIVEVLDIANHAA